MTRLEYSPFSQHFLRARPLLSWCPSQQEPKKSAPRYNITLRRSSYKYYRGWHVMSVRSVALKLMILFQISRVQTREGRHGAPRPWLRYRAGRSCCALCGWDRPCCSQLVGAAHWLPLSLGCPLVPRPPLFCWCFVPKNRGLFRGWGWATSETQSVCQLRRDPGLPFRVLSSAGRSTLS